MSGDHRGRDDLDARLQCDLGEAPPDLAAALRATCARSLPAPGPTHLAQVLAAVHTARDRAAAADLLPTSRPRAGTIASLVAAIRSQVPVVGLPFWLACALVIVLGVLIGNLWLQPLVSPLLLTAPPRSASAMPSAR